MTMLLAGTAVASVVFVGELPWPPVVPTTPEVLDAAPVRVVFAARDLHPGVQISASDIYRKAAPTQLANHGLTPQELVVGRVPHERILANEVVRSERLADPKKATGFNALVPRGHRAVALPLQPLRSTTQGMLDALEPPAGNRPDIDLIVIGPTDADPAARQATTLLRKVTVVDAYLHRPDVAQWGGEMVQDEPTLWVVLSLTRAQAEEVAHARGGGMTFVASIRNDLTEGCRTTVPLAGF